MLLKDPTAAILGNIIQVVVIQPIFISFLNAMRHKDKSIGKKLIGIMTTPLIILPLMGILLNYLQIHLPSPMVSAVAQMGSGASGIALFAFGLTLGTTKITKECLKFDLLGVVFAKNFLHPLIALCVAYVIKLEGYWFNSLVIAASAPTAFVVYLISKQFSVEEETVKKVIALSSVISMISLILIACLLVV
jgi:predicted permease